jgi:hypothetical protein
METEVIEDIGAQWLESRQGAHWATAALLVRWTEEGYQANHKAKAYTADPTQKSR